MSGVKERLPKSLFSLAELIDCPLYAVGGCVRNSLLNLPTGDVDICAKLLPDEVIARLTGSKFGAVPVNARLGTLKIYVRGDSKDYFEYTTFREDSYPASGAHSPEGVFFTDDILADARRRDFKANAVYYDVGAEQIVDVLGGVADIEAKVLSATRSPDEVFGEDGLRIMRLARLAAELGFTPEQRTMEAAKRHAALLADISAERKMKELFKVMSADSKYPQLGIKDAHVKGIRLLDEIGALPYVLPSLASTKGFPQRTKYHNLDVFNHSIAVYGYAPERVRLAALLHDVGKPRSVKEIGTMKAHAAIGKELVRRDLGKRGLACSNAEIARTAALVEWHMYDLKCDAAEEEVRLFIVKHSGLIADLAALKRADILASAMPDGGSPSADRLEKLLGAMKEDGTPFSIKELLVDGNDMINLGIEDKKRGTLIKALLEDAVKNPALRTREAQLEYLRRGM